MQILVCNNTIYQLHHLCYLENKKYDEVPFGDALQHIADSQIGGIHSE